MELTLDQALQKGIEAHKAGRMQSADRYYTAILKKQPKHPDANHNMGVLAVDVGKVSEALPFFKTALEANSGIAQFWLSYIDALLKLNRTADAKSVLDQAKNKGFKGTGFDKIDEQLRIKETQEADDPDLIRALDHLRRLISSRKFNNVLSESLEMLPKYKNSASLHNIMGIAYKALNQDEKAEMSFRTSITLQPGFFKPYNNLGNLLKKQGKLDEAISTFTKATSIKPDSYELHNNLGNIFQDMDRLEEAIEAYNNALLIKPDYADAFKNMGIALQQHGKKDEAIEAFNRALSIKPDYAEVHRTLSSIKVYTRNDEQFLNARELYKHKDLDEYSRCNLSFALAKMYEDVGELDQTFSHLSEGNALRKKLLKYSINQDIELFTRLRKSQPNLKKSSLKITKNSIYPTPIFILGMPRSGTTLVEQIISSHSEVFGAGELGHVTQLGGHLVLGSAEINTATILKFREAYLFKLSKLSNGKQFATDKMPQNFCFIPLICAAFPEAKIVHVRRNAAATCWSSYRQYFEKDGLGYCYDLLDMVLYYELYDDLMKHWQSIYTSRIYDLNYENLTTDQENQTKKLITHLGLNWETAFLSPQKNNRSVKTASQQQVRRKVYQGSSREWRKFEPYLNGAFDTLRS